MRFKGNPHGEHIADVNLYFVTGSREKVTIQISNKI
jgi:hypothetical protein